MMSAIISHFMTSLEQESLEIARGLKQRDPDLLDQLIERYQYRLLRYLVSLVGGRETAEDLFQETWIRVLEKGRQYNGKTKFDAWLFAIARHLVIDLMRKKKVTSLEDSTPIDKQTPFDIQSAELSPFEITASHEQAGRLVAALDHLGAFHREVLVLRFQEEMTLEEMSLVTGAPVSTVKSRLYRSLEALRNSLEGNNDATKRS
jgi:RNA polymerase sigma-70 factor (ECF subfamily)